MKRVILVLLLGVLSTPIFAAPYDNMCEVTQNTRLKYSKILPLSIDDITVLTGFNTNCKTKTVEYKYQIFGRFDDLKFKTNPTVKAKLSAKFVKFVNLQCKRGYPKHNWNVINYYYNTNLILVFKFVVNADDCKRLTTKKK